MSDERKRILTGIRPTGPLHLGHYGGALEQWLRLQDEYECFFLIADYQVSDHADDIDRIRNAVFEVALDWLAVGLDPERGHFVIEKLGALIENVDERAYELRKTVQQLKTALGTGLTQEVQTCLEALDQNAESLDASLSRFKTRPEDLTPQPAGS